MGRARGTVVLVDTGTGEALEVKARSRHNMDGGSYTLGAKADEVPLYSLALTGAEWAIVDWARTHGAAGTPIKINPADVAPEVLCTETTAKTALARLVKLNILLKTSPRSATYQLNPRRYWEGSGESQGFACRRLNPPAITPDAKALQAAEKKGAGAKRKRPRNVRAVDGGDR